MEGVKTNAMEQAYYTRAGLKRTRVRGSTMSLRTARRPNLEQLTSAFMKYAEDFASAIIKETQQDLLRQLDERSRTIEKLERDLRLSADAVASLRAAIKSSEENRTRDILKKAGVISSE